MDIVKITHLLQYNHLLQLKNIKYNIIAKYSAGENGTEIDFVLVGKENRKYLRDVKVIPGELQHRLVVTDLVKKKVRKVVRKEATERKKVWKRNEDDTREKFEGRARELVIADAPDLWKCFYGRCVKGM